jgi:hypothetical protein
MGSPATRESRIGTLRAGVRGSSTAEESGIFSGLSSQSQGFETALAQRTVSAPWGAPNLAALPAAAVIALLAASAAVCCTLWVLGRLRRFSKVRRAARAGVAERAAAGVLASAGYQIVGRQVRQRWSLRSNGRELSFDLIADYVVEAGGARYVAEVKTGARALDLRHGPTRRQLLEYRQAFGVSGVLLVDAEGGEVQHVEFRESGKTRLLGFRAVAWFSAGILLGIALAQHAR